MSGCQNFQPNNNNVCSANLGDNYQMPDLCYNPILDPKSIVVSKEFCESMGSNGEWELNLLDVGSPCFYVQDQLDIRCSAFLNYSIPFLGCTLSDPPGLCLSTVGVGGVCKRTAFNGDPLQCCLNNYDKTGTGCFSDSSGKDTCDPKYRNNTSSECKVELLPYCSGTLPTDDPASTAWINRWVDANNKPIPGGCYDIVLDNLYNPFSPPPPSNNGQCNQKPLGEISNSGYIWSQELMAQVLQHYKENGLVIGALPGFRGYHPFQDFLYNDLCSRFPGLCQNGLAQSCANYTTERLSLNPEAAAWCGCNLPTVEYEDYANRFNIPPACTPICNRSGVLPIADGELNPIQCTQNICLIDDISINIISSQVNGQVDISQLCGNCGPNSQCSCFINNDTISVNNSLIQGNVSINESCGSFKCTQNNPGIPGPSLISTGCDSINEYNKFKQELDQQNQEVNRNKNFWIFFIIIFFLLIIFFFLLFLNPIFS